MNSAAIGEQHADSDGRGPHDARHSFWRPGIRLVSEGFNPAAGGTAGTTGAGGSSGSMGGAGFGGALVDGGGGKRAGCSAVDILFVIDNSSSMCTYEKGLVQAFPFFVDAVNSALPAGTDLHVGITTSSFCEGGSHSETNCVAQEPPATIQTVFKRPMDGMQPGNGYQGRLLEHGGKAYVAAKTGDAQGVQAMKDRFAQAAISVGCGGCAFDFHRRRRRRCRSSRQRRDERRLHP